jgi:large subunit ribosomal protein L21e
MVQKSYGKMRGTRKKLKLSGRPGTTKFLQSFSVGDSVHIHFTTTIRIQHPRMQGSTGKVVEKRGRSYVVEVRDGGVMKKLFVRPEHLKLQK